MATTTNYGWETADDTDLVKDGALAMRTLGSAIDTTTKALNPSTTLGDIEYRSATANTNTRLAIGSTGDVLTVAGGVPSWVAPAGGGKVLQVVSTTNSTAKTITSTTYTDTNLTLSITPTLATSKILILITQMSNTSSSGSTNKGSGLRIVRGATTIYEPAPGKYEMQYVQAGSGPIDVLAPISLVYLDSPATTSSTTYKTQGALNSTSDSASLKYQTGSSISTITLLEIGA
jgi:hypothetical protein